jgi:hypothetical protein
LAERLIAVGPSGNYRVPAPGGNFRKIRETSALELRSQAVGLDPDRRLRAG